LDGDNDSIRRVDGSMRSGCACAAQAGRAFGKNGWAARFKSTQNDDKHQSNVRQKGESRCSSNTVNQAGVFWRKLWKISCPPKVRHLMWRLAQNSLALKMNICRRGMQLDTRCPLCFRFDKDGGHCFLKCKFVKRCWESLSLEPIRQNLLLKRSAWEVIMEVIAKKEEDRLKTVLLLWKWWDFRNKVDRGEKMQSTSPGRMLLEMC